MKLKYVGTGHHRVIEPEDLTRHGLSEASVDVWRGDLVEVPDDVGKWLLSEYSQEASDWEEVTLTDDHGQGGESPSDAGGDTTPSTSRGGRSARGSSPSE